ncbi:MAG: hypothetical protein ACLR0P_13890 [Oscillospiraceae bacterium]
MTYSAWRHPVKSAGAGRVHYTRSSPPSWDRPTEDTCQVLLTALMVHLVQLAEEYPDHITVLEV